MDRTSKIKQMLEQSPKDCFLWHALGLEYQKLQDMPQALACFERVLTINKEYLGTYYHLGKTLEMAGRTEQAIQAYQDGITIAVKLKDNHARNELQMALDDLTDF